jgi:CBS domain-containing protein
VEVAVHISDVLRGKGTDVVTVTPDTTVRDLLEVLAEFGIGAAVVSAGGGAVDGIVSERDVVRAMAARGAAVLSEDLSTIMTRDVICADPRDHVDGLMQIMTQGRFRHVPVLVEGRLAGIVSIGDVVKSRLAELEVERDSLASYINAAST